MPQLLHGVLIATIEEIEPIHTGCGFNLFQKVSGSTRTGNIGKRFLGQVKRLMACQTKNFGFGLYATVDLDKSRVARTQTIPNETSHPQWFESFRIYCAHYISNIIFTVKDDNPVGATLIGRAYVPVNHVIDRFSITRFVDILDEDQKPINSKILVKLKFLHITQDNSWSRGIGSPHFQGVSSTFFKQRTGCKVSLYLDADVRVGYFDPIVLSPEESFKPQGCWEDIFDAINDAKVLIYIAGWSVSSKITLIRDPRRPKEDRDLTLGELLKRKANEGVLVLMLVWDDRTSIPHLKKDGLMATHDQETEDYFQNTKVHCHMCPRNPGGGRSKVQGLEIATMFTHHQKTIVVDKEVPGGQSQKRRIVSFIGGIDLCDGRYDTPEHPLFSTLSTTHHDDFHQPNFPGASIKKGGPREPWHDIHCQLEGPVAWDVLYNFEQRWEKQFGRKLLIPSDDLDKVVVYPSPVTSQEDANTWNVQIFRSIDSGAVNFPKNPNGASPIGLVTGKDVTFERSIQDAYINAIRRARNFIYIENQYFLGSSFGWKSDDIKVEDIGALHLIPKELSLKILSKIEVKERFSVYIVIPMWPEGIPESASVQAILDWQRRTMEMMYSDIAQALKRKGLDANPRDYLNFYCLGMREKKKNGEYIPTENPEPDSDYCRAQHARRFMIYVHAKMMIVDDEYIIIGSANINQRSMDGARDTEIAMGAFQPHHLTTKQPTNGQILGFRLALWGEHLGFIDKEFLHPESESCIQAVNYLAQKNWEEYSSEILDKDMGGHLLPYPIQVTNEGEIETLTGFEFFPDTKARVSGAKSDLLPPILTT